MLNALEFIVVQRGHLTLLVCGISGYKSYRPLIMLCASDIQACRSGPSCIPLHFIGNLIAHMAVLGLVFCN